MEYKIKVLDEAIQDVQEAIDWYDAIDTDLSLDIESKFYSAQAEIVKHPLIYTKIRTNFRKCTIERFQYNIIFRVKRDLITIVAFAHQKRKPYWKKR